MTQHGARETFYRKALSETGPIPLNGLDNPFRRPDYFDAPHIKSQQKTPDLLR
ncbi:hypothetical protein [Burkholderia guangdongensis]|uniref:hypothetical protein n=1 Tax=Burkholderia guangdongensis TaxID=1792500 RepID=UPI0015C72624|nr:hypothetical protein [Burkholderia guangdongensis]